jgi:hypothetical protein
LSRKTTDPETERSFEMMKNDPDKLAEKIAKLDPSSIIIVSLIDEVGRIFGFYVNEAHREKYPPDRKKYEMIAARVTVGFGSALASEKDGVSETEGLVLIRKTSLHYYTRVNGSKPFIVGVWFTKNANVTQMSPRVRAIFGL